MSYGVVRTDKMTGTDNRAYLVSAKYMGSGSAATVVDNGCVVKLDGLMDGEREVYKAITPEATSALKDIALVATPEVIYDNGLKNLDEFTNKAGTIIRGYRLHTGDIFSVTVDALSGATLSTAVGALVELQAGTKLKVVTSATGGSTQVGKIVAIEETSRYKYYVIQVG